jgi:Mn2+/Fe2+ NRAMP family transporter
MMASVQTFQLSRWKGISLGVLTAVGGFVDMGGIIACSQAGALYGLSLVWTLIPGLIGLIVYADMSGRVVIASGRTLFDVMRARLGFRVASIPLVATAIVNTLTLVIELAGMTLTLELATRISYLLWFPVASLFMGIILWKAGFELLENSTAILGLAMLVVVVAMVRLAPSWSQIGSQALHPVVPSGQLAAYLFAAIGLLGSYMTPYQFYFYSSGAVEEEWSGPDLLVNRVTSLIGSGFGAIIDLGLMVAAATVLFPAHQQVNSLGDAGHPVMVSLGVAGWVLFLIGTFAVTLGAGLETALSGAYSVCQYFGWDWGKHGRPRQAPMFHLSYLVMLVLAMLFAYTGVNPIELTLITMAVAAMTLPFSFLPLLIVANDDDYVGLQRNTPAINLLAIIILLLLIVVTVATVPLFILTGG